MSLCERERRGKEGRRGRGRAGAGGGSQCINLIPTLRDAHGRVRPPVQGGRSEGKHHRHHRRRARARVRARCLMNLSATYHIALASWPN